MAIVTRIAHAPTVLDAARSIAADTGVPLDTTYWQVTASLATRYCGAP